ncbi:MAG: hypothetical protein ABIL09_01600 [Gemmatimonadota bacterium]
MRKSIFGVLAVALVLALAGGASAHIGSNIYLIFEIADADVGDINLKDGSLDDWYDVVGDPSLRATDFFADPTVGEGAQYDPADMDYQIWLAWNGTANTLWCAMERIDDKYVNEYAGGNLGELWRHDAIEFMLDGDHSGGEYGINAGNCGEGCTEEDVFLANNRTAQQYVAIPDAPDGRNVGYLGAGSDWVNALPYADGGGLTTGESPAVSVMEFYVTPFDNLIYNSPGDSKASELAANKIIGFQLSVPDFDTEPGAYKAFHTLTGQAATWRYAERFADGRLIGAGGGTAVESNSWGRIKASF